MSKIFDTGARSFIIATQKLGNCISLNIGLVAI
jgi:hypothetical protein